MTLSWTRDILLLYDYSSGWNDARSQPIIWRRQIDAQSTIGSRSFIVVNSISKISREVVDLYFKADLNLTLRDLLEKFSINHWTILNYLNWELGKVAN